MADVSEIAHLGPDTGRDYAALGAAGQKAMLGEMRDARATAGALGI